MSPNSKIASKRKLPPDDDETVPEIWKNVHQRIDQFYAKLYFMPTRSDMDLYGLIYECCSTICPPPKKLRLEDENDDVKQQYVTIGNKLREIVVDFLNQYLILVKKWGVTLDGEDILQFYVKQRSDFRFLSKELEEICSDLNDQWIQVEDFESELLSIRGVTNTRWSSHISGSLHPQVQNSILKLIEDERNGETINVGLVRNAVNSIVELNLNKNDKVDLSIYRQLIERIFFGETERFYVKESDEFLSQNSVSLYLKKVEIRLLEEEKRVKAYLHESTLETLLKTCDKALIEKHLEALIAHFSTCLKENKTDDLNRAFRMIRRIPKSLNELFSIVESHVHDEGVSAIENCGEGVSNDPKLYVETIIRLYNDCLSKVSATLDDYPGVVQACDKGFRKFINKNFATQMENSSSAKSPELLAKYCDLLLKKNPENPVVVDIEDNLNNVITVFKYVDDKDVFQTLYSKLLAKRLIYQSSSSTEAEDSMIEKLKLACGNHYTYKLHRMFNDIEISRDLNNKVRDLFKISDESIEFDFDVHVLSSGTWPYYQPCTLALPVELEKNLQRFTTFYNWLYNGRKLQWQYQLSRGELVTNCFQNRYTLQVSILQMAILLLYNTHDMFTVQELQENTQIQMEYLTQSLQILLKAKLLICETAENDDLQPTSIIQIFLGYKNKKQRVNLNVPMKVEVKKDKEASVQTVETERKILLQAAIVRAMKTRKQLKHQELLTEIYEELSKQFIPTDGLIEKSIGVLIEQGYFERNGGESDVYTYLA